MRCDINISLHSRDNMLHGNRVEVKNVMGIRFVEKVIEFEMRRQSKLLDDGLMPEFETRRYDAINDKTISLRSKNDDFDYRFIREADLPRIRVEPGRVLACQQVLDSMVLPFDKKLQMIKDYSMTVEDISTIFNHPETLELFERLTL